MSSPPSRPKEEGAALASPRRLAMRSLLVQGSWNYRTLQGSGLAWSLLRDDSSPAGSSAPSGAIARHAEVFNAHPYLTPIAMGAIEKAESEGADLEQIGRLRDALRSPLGSLGDRLIWGAWRPACLLGAVVVALAGGVPSLVVGVFLLAYNSLHLPLRLRGAAVGLRGGLDVAQGIRELNLAGWAERTGRVGVLLLGVTVGMSVALALGLPAHRGVLVMSGSACFLIGFTRGESVRGWGPVVLISIVLAGFLLGPALAGAGPP